MNWDLIFTTLFSAIFIKETDLLRRSAPRASTSSTATQG